MNRWMIALASFAATVALAAWQDWNAAEIAWSMWLASLVGGYSLVLVRVLRHAPERTGVARRVVLLAFFSIHFLGFHFIHAQVLGSLLPLDQAETRGGVPLLACLKLFWPFLIITALRFGPRLLAGWRERGRLRVLEPYRAVARNHLAILAAALAGSILGDSPVLYAILVVYFFPFGEIRRHRPGNRG
jgi:hypothetical protein